MSDTNFTAVITAESITLLDGTDELVMWDKAEWVEDPTLVPAIANAIRIGYTEGPDGIRARLIVGNFLPEEKVADGGLPYLAACTLCGRKMTAISEYKPELCAVCVVDTA